MRQSSSGAAATNNEQSTLSQDDLSNFKGKAGCQNWPFTTSAHSAAGGERDQQQLYVGRREPGSATRIRAVRKT